MMNLLLAYAVTFFSFFIDNVENYITFVYIVLKFVFFIFQNTLRQLEDEAEFSMMSSLQNCNRKDLKLANIHVRFHEKLSYKHL